MDNQTAGINDQELNQMIAGLGSQNQDGQAGPTPQVAEPSAAQSPSSTPPQDTAPPADPATAPVAAPDPAVQIAQNPPTEPMAMPPTPTGDSNLNNIKQDALKELRPLVTKLELPADEKFDTLLLIIRSTDDVALLPEAYNTARAIVDETRRAQALLDVIKEIDYFGQNKAA